MELHELEVRDRRARPPRHRHAVAGRDAGIGRLAEDLAEPAAREDRRLRPDQLQPVARVMGDRAEHAAVAAFGGEQIDREALLEDADRSRRLRLRLERAGQFAAGGVAVGVHDAAAAMAAFASEVDLARGVRVETHAPLDQTLEFRGSLLGQESDRLGIVEPAARLDRVERVRLGRVVWIDRGGDSALRHAVLESSSGAFASRITSPCSLAATPPAGPRPRLPRRGRR